MLTTLQPCTCGNPACLVRIKRKLQPFCRMPRDTAVVPELGHHIAYRDSRSRPLYVYGTSGRTQQGAQALLSDRRANGESFPQEFVRCDAELSTDEKRIAGLP
jgi:hypothetical protein